MPEPSVLLPVLRDLNRLDSLTPDQWSTLFAECRASGLTARIASMIDAHGRPGSMAPRFGHHIQTALHQYAVFTRDLWREVEFLRKALATLDTPIVVLKGAAYVVCDLPPARGRFFSDIDLLVDRSKIAQTESQLMLAGWTAGKIDAYDQRYYREWSHEIPPLTHVQRSTTVDLHHALVMPTCRLGIDSAPLLKTMVPIDGLPGWFRLGDEALVLHACAHLLLNSEFDRGLRDLGDIDLLVRHFCATTTEFLPRLFDLAAAAGLEEIAARALLLCHRIYSTPLPAWPGIKRRRLDPVLNLLGLATTTRHPNTRPVLQTMADQALALRELGLRFPARILVWHLWHKAFSAPRENQTSA
jgi:hypothetical protein